MDVLRFLLDILAFYAVYLLLSLSLNIEYGFTGIPNFGKVMFFAAGAFTVGALATRLTMLWVMGRIPTVEEFRNYDVAMGTEASRFLAHNPLLAVALFLSLIVLSMAIAALLGYIASYPAIRLREDYLGITLIVAGELMRNIVKNYDPIICGTFGVFVPDPFSWASGRVHVLVVLAVMFGFALAAYYTVEKLVNSPFGRLLKAVRDSEAAAEALGKDVVKVRMASLVVGSALAGLAGSLYAFYVGSVHPDDFTPVKTFLVWLIVVLGGPGNNAGVAIGAFFYVTVDRLIAYFKYYINVPFDVNYLSYIILSVVLILVLFYRPKGLIPEEPVKTPVIEKLEKEKAIK